MKKHYSFKNAGSKKTVLQLWLSLFVLTFLFSPAKAQLTGWAYRDGINIHENAGSQKLNYQVLLDMNTAALVSAGKMQASGNDIRFSKDCNGSVLLNYFIETGMNTANTMIWVETDTLDPSGNYLMYMWYGNATAAAASNFNTTFPVSTQLVVPAGSVTLSGTNNYSWFEIQAGATVVVGPNSPFVINARMIRISGTLNGNGSGYLGGALSSNGSGPGMGKASLGNAGTYGGGGGSYGGSGGKGERPTATSGTQTGLPGIVYGTLAGDSIDMGSGGSGAASAGGAGGGGITLNADVIQVTGAVNANGSDGNVAALNGGAGAGSGGGIRIKGNRVSISGMLSAKGGQGGSGGYSGAGGGGGRIKIFSDFSLVNSASINVSGGPIGNLPTVADSTATAGSAGTTFTGTWLSKVPTYAMVPHVVLSGLPTAVCQGSQVSFTASPGFTAYDFQVNTSSVQNTSSGLFSSASLGNNDVIKVLAADANGCADTSNAITVTVYAKPVVDAGSDTTICQGSAAVIGGAPTASGGGGTYTNSWAPSTGLTSSSSPNPSANPSATMVYTVTVTDNNGCSDTSSAAVTVNSLPVITATPSPSSICMGDSALLSATGGQSYTWAPAAELSSTSGASVMAGPSGTATYTVTGTDVNNCSGTGTVTLTVNACTGIQQSADPYGLKYYPNPVSNKLNIEAVFSSPAKANLYICNTLGKIVMNINDGIVSGAYVNEVDVTSLPAGMYFITLKTGDVNNMQRFIKAE